MKFLFVCLVSSVALADDVCWAPNAPNEGNPDRCTQCVQHPAWDATSCEVGDQSYPCSATIDACCGSSGIINSGACQGISHSDCTSRCISNTNSTPVPDPTELPLPDVSGTCVNAVSTQNGGSNVDCMNKCQAGVNAGTQVYNIPEFASGVCSIQSWNINNGRTDVTSSPCFEKWVYGYSQEAVNAALDGLYHFVDTPAQCQALCQQEPSCINWIWFSDLQKDSEPQYTHGCALKNQTQVEKALEQSTATDTTPVSQVAWCNYGMPYDCNHLYNCLPCAGVKRCVWESDMHVTGWKYCSSIYDDCNPNVDPTGPTVNPAGPTDSPAGPTDSPAGPTDSPAGPTESPADPTDSPTDNPVNPTDSPTDKPIGPTDEPAGPTGPCPNPNPSPCGCSCSDSNCGCCRPACQQGCSGAGCCGNNDIVVRIGDKPQFFKMEIHN